MVRRISSLLALVALLGCEQENQPLPFDVVGESSQTISAEGGIVSTPAGAAIRFPPGALSGNVTVTLTETAVPAPAQAAGMVASSAFAIEPAGTPLATAADLELKFMGSLDADRAWLATVVGVTNGDVQTYPSTRVDLGTRIVSTRVERLGTYLVTIPPAASIFPVQALVAGSLTSVRGADLLPDLSVDSITVDCGELEDPCTGLGVTATQNLFQVVEDAALVYPRIEGALRIGARQMTGSIRATAPIRLRLSSGQTAENIRFDAVVSPTAWTAVPGSGSAILAAQVVPLSGGSTESSSGEAQETTTIVIPPTGSEGSVTIRRTFDIDTPGIADAPVTIAITFPVTIHR